MKRREFVKSILIGAVVASVAPTDFLTPFSPPQQVALLTQETMEKLFREYITPGLYNQIMQHSKMWDKFRKR